MEEMRSLDIYSNDRALQWKRAFGDDYRPIERRTVKGYDFVLAHIVMGDEPGLRWGEPLYIPGLEEFFATNAFDRTRPFFYVQHKIPRGTVGGDKGRAYDYEVTAILRKAYVRRIVGTKRVFSPKCHLAPERDKGPVVCLFGKTELPSDHDTLEFEVRPANAFGAQGEPIRSEPRSFNPTPCATTLW